VIPYAVAGGMRAFADTARIVLRIRRGRFDLNAFGAIEPGRLPTRSGC